MTQTSTLNLFATEYEEEIEVWLRRRFRNFCIALLILGGLEVLMGMMLTQPIGTDGSMTGFIIYSAALIPLLGIISWNLGGRKQGSSGPEWKEASREIILRGASRMIFQCVGIMLLMYLLLRLTGHAKNINLLFTVFLWHSLACLFLPWRPQESLRPFYPLMLAWALICLFAHPEPATTVVGRILIVLFAPGIFLPGLGICAWRLHRHSESFQQRMVGSHFLAMRQEMHRARSIHESMFPQPYRDDFVRFEYTYLPMRELGGDFIHLYVGPAGRIYATLLDVTGHGLTAALTVNRLYGELERIRGELPRIEPGELLSLLNRYVLLTLVKHNIFVTAMCLTLDPHEGILQYANAGHPPAFLRGANGKVTDLASTTALLGAVEEEEFGVEQQIVELAPGDVMMIYTDGAFEAKNRAGSPFGLDALRELMRRYPAPGNWPQFIESAVRKHNAGRAEDDILIAAFTYLEQRVASPDPRQELGAEV